MEPAVVLLPTYNERATLPRMVTRLTECADTDVLVIDDSSPDGTGDIAEALRGRYPRLSVLHRRRREGLGRAYVNGFRVALAEGYSRVLTMDADLSHDPADVPRLLRALEYADVAIGSRHRPLGGRVENWPRWRQLLSRAGSLYARLPLCVPAWEVATDFHDHCSEALDVGRIQAQEFFFQVERMYWAVRAVRGELNRRSSGIIPKATSPVARTRRQKGGVVGTRK